MTYIAPAQIERLVERLYQTPPGMIETVKPSFPISADA